MRILVLGGTIFLGRHLVLSAQERGHTLTLFHRGQHNPGLFPEIEHVFGDRDGGLEALNGRTWDAVIDTCGYFPRIVRQSAAFFASRAAHYTFVSSISAYAHFREPFQKETAPLGVTEDVEATKITGENYGPLKVLCEQAVEEAFPNSTFISRPGYIVGAHDPSDRFTSLVRRVAQAGDVVVPGEPNMRVEFIDVRDLAEWTIRMIEQQATGAFNNCGPEKTCLLRPFLETCQKVAQSDARLHFMPGEVLKAEGIEPDHANLWWVGDEDADYRYVSHMDCSKARGMGLTFRSVEETIRATLEWDKTRPQEVPLKRGLTREQELVLLSKQKG